jgi:phospholipase C
MIRRCLLALAVVLIFAGAQRAHAAVPHFDHIVIIMLENHGDASVIGNPNAPRLTALARDNGYASHYYGVTHPSLPNYVAITSGDTWYSNSDDPTQRFNHINIVDTLEARHISWTAYMQAIPSVGFSGDFYPADEENALYVIRHDPFMLYDDVRDNAQRRAHVVSMDRLTQDLRAGKLAQFVWVSPDVCHDMHGMSGKACPYSDDAALKRTSDAYVVSLVQEIRSSKAWTKRSVIFIMTDETDYDGSMTSTGGWASATGCCDSPVVPKNAAFFPQGGMYGGGPSPLIVISPIAKAHFTSDTPYNHYSVLRTIELSWNLAQLGMTADAPQVPDLSEFFNPIITKHPRR